MPIHASLDTPTGAIEARGQRFTSNRGSQMKRLTATLLFLVSFTAMSTSAQKASLKEQILGTWIHVSTTVTAPDGKKTDRPGQGVVVYAPDGYFAFVNVRE
jgi:hypothetical protein